MNNYKTVFALILLSFFMEIPITRAQKALFSTEGLQPALFVGSDGTLDLVFGKGNAIYYSHSEDEGGTFSTPMLVDSLTGLHLGVSRGPRIASSRQTVVITAVDRLGDLYAYTLNRAKGTWGSRRRVNDIPEVAKEGFNALTGDGEGRFFVTWLDLRNDKKNKIFGATSTDDGKTWNKNRLVYSSPDSTVCECCQPTAVMKGSEVYVMFRNWISGSRDMYVAHSKDGGQSFQPPQKMGEGTWKLNACPMDGGDLSVGSNDGFITVWRRNNQLYLSRPGEKELPVAEGRNASIAVSGPSTFIVWHQAGQVWYGVPGKTTSEIVGNGRYPRVVSLSNNRAFCVWEDGGTIRGKMLDRAK